MTVLDCSANNGDLSLADLAPYQMVILDLNPAWTPRQMAVVHQWGKPFGLYSSDQTLSWPSTRAFIVRLLHLDPQAVPIWIDWFEFLTQAQHGGLTPQRAAEATLNGVLQAHDDGVKVGLYGAELNAWPWYDRVGVSKITTGPWVARSSTPRRPFDLHQFGGRGDIGDFNALRRGLTVAQLVTKMTGPYEQEDDLTPEQAAQLDRIDRATTSLVNTDMIGYFIQKAKRHGVYDGASPGWLDRLAKAEAQHERSGLGVQPTPTEPTPLTAPYVSS